MSFPQRLRELRQGQGLSQEKLGAMVGLNRITILNYEKGNREPEDIDIIKRLAAALNTTTDYLLCHTDVRFSTVQTVAEARAEYLTFTGDPEEDEIRRIILEAFDRDFPQLQREQVPEDYRRLAKISKEVLHRRRNGKNL